MSEQRSPLTQRHANAACAGDSDSESDGDSCHDDAPDTVFDDWRSDSDSEDDDEDEEEEICHSREDIPQCTKLDQLQGSAVGADFNIAFHDRAVSSASTETITSASTASRSHSQRLADDVDSDAEAADSASGKQPLKRASITIVVTPPHRAPAEAKTVRVPCPPLGQVGHFAAARLREACAACGTAPSFVYCEAAATKFDAASAAFLMSLPGHDDVAVGLAGVVQDCLAPASCRGLLSLSLSLSACSIVLDCPVIQRTNSLVCPTLTLVPPCAPWKGEPAQLRAARAQ